MNCKNFVFTSVGNQGNFDTLWVGSNASYHIYAIYYGDDEATFEKYKSKTKFIMKRKGSKFQNFKFFYENYPDIIQQYDRFFILDDDIIMNVNDINNMFALSRKYNLEICGPSFKPDGKISELITMHKPHTILTYTNFVEVNTPLFTKQALTNLMNILDESLIGWGIDYLYIWCNGLMKKTSYAIIHSIFCTNPYSCTKLNKSRELYLIKNAHNRRNIWESYSKKINCPPSFHVEEYSDIKLSLGD